MSNRLGEIIRYIRAIKINAYYKCQEIYCAGKKADM